MEMARAGLATVYEQAGAVYGRDGLDNLKQAEHYARSRKLGMWSQRNVISPAAYKAQARAASES